MNKSLNFNKKLLATLVASTAFTGFAGAVNAQTTTDVADEIVVTGIKASLERSLDIKRNSSQIVEAITADDIGKMPDQNVTESLQRVPGIQIDRAGGQGTTVRIRGLGQNVTTLNGENFVSGLEYYQTGEARTGFQDSLEGVPSELLGGVEVYKTPLASNIEGAIGGIVNLKTRDPLKLKAPLAVVSLKGDYGDVSKSVKPNASVVLGNNWGDFGAIVSLSKDESVVHDDSAQNINRNSWGWLQDPSGVDYVVPGMLYNTDQEQTRDRTGASVNLAWSPSDDTAVTLDWFHSKLSIDTRQYAMKYTENTDGGSLITSMPYTIDKNGVLTSGSFTTSGENNGNRDITDITTDNVKLGFRKDTDKWHFDGDLSYAKAKLKQDAAYSDARYQPYAVNTFTGVTAGNPSGWSSQAPNTVAGDTGARYWNFAQSNSGIPTVSFSPAAQAALTNPDNFLYKSSWAFGNRVDNKAVNFSLNAKYDLDFGDFKDVQFGFRSSDSKVNFDRGQYLVDIGHNTLDVANGVGGSVPDGHAMGQTWAPYTYYLDASIGNPDGSAPGVIPWHTYSQLPKLYTDVTNFFPSGNGVHNALFTDPAKMGNPAKWLSNLANGNEVIFQKDPVASWNVETKTQALYAQTDLKGDAVPYDLNFGVRVVKTDVTSKGGETQPTGDLWSGTASWNGPIETAGTFSTLKSYTDVLPSLNFSVNTSTDSKVRASLSRQMARPSDSALGQGNSYNFTRNDARGGYEFVNGNSGNPLLNPYRATATDLSYEWYFDDLSYVSVGSFFKIVDSFQAGYSYALSVPDTTTISVPGQAAGSTIGQINSVENGTGGTVKGAEFALQKGFDNGFGITVNYTYSDSSTDLNSETHKNLALPGVSKNSFNVIGFYEAHGVHARIAYAWRDQFLSPDNTFEQIAGNGIAGDAHENASTFARFYNAYGQVDMSLSYDVTDNLSISLDGINITGEEQRRYLEYKNLFTSNDASERRFTFGAKYQF